MKYKKGDRVLSIADRNKGEIGIFVYYSRVRGYFEKIDFGVIRFGDEMVTKDLKNIVLAKDVMLKKFYDAVKVP